MQKLIRERIKFFMDQILSDLDCNDTQSALMHRATIKELEFLLQSCEANPSDPSDLLENFYNTEELAKALNLHTTSITRNAKKQYNGVKIPKGWLFPKHYIDQLHKDRNCI